jgi:hypothetical protein
MNSPEIEYRRLRAAFEAFIRDRYHKGTVTDEEMQDIIENWIENAESDIP